MDIQFAGGIIILGILLPLWIMFGIADWYQHRKSQIEFTSGWQESLLHLMLTGQAAVAVLAALLLEINATVLLIMIGAFASHEITTNVDIGYAAPHRFISATEQRVHDYLTAIPVATLLIALIMYSGQLLAIFGLGNEKPDFILGWKARPLPVWYIAAFLAASSVNAFLYLEEFTRCMRSRRQFFFREQH
jgi:hypothetical protein